MSDETVFHRVEMRVIHVAGVIPLIADRMFPEAPLPDAALPAPVPHRRAAFGRRERLGERLFQSPPATGKSSSSGGKVHMQCQMQCM
jgi:hypothetical protein